MALGERSAAGVQQRLQLGVEVVDAEQPAPHRRQHLDVAARVHAEPSRHAVGDQALQGVEQALWLDPSADADFHFIERDTRLQSGSSTICRLGFTTYIGINLDTYQMYLSTRYGTEDLWIVSDLYRWDTFSDRVEVSIRDEVYRYGWYEPHDIVASFSLYGSW